MTHLNPLPLSIEKLPETYQDCLDFFFARNQFAIKLGLDIIHALLEKLGRPDAGMIFLHVAGTNGKGSVCANLAALLKATGRKRIGLYTSPHLVSFRERILVDHEPIPSVFILDWLRRAHGFILELNATYFECVTALALDYFKSKECEVIVLETGLGGRLDATNAVLPALTVITSISLDHTTILGDTVEAIWGEKIGILKPAVPMVVQESAPHLLQVLRTKASEFASPVFALDQNAWSRFGDSDLQFHGRYATYTLPSSLRPESHQVENLALSLLAMEVFLSGPLPPGEALLPFLTNAKLPGRTQLLQSQNCKPVLLDGAHNPGGMDALAAYIHKEFPHRNILALFAVMRDKDYLEVFRQVLTFADQVGFISLEKKFPRALPYSELVAGLSKEEQAKVISFNPNPISIDEILKNRTKEKMDSETLEMQKADLVVVCGSLYLLGEVIPMLLPYFKDLSWFRQFLMDGEIGK